MEWYFLVGAIGVCVALQFLVAKTQKTAVVFFAIFMHVALFVTAFFLNAKLEQLLIILLVSVIAYFAFLSIPTKKGGTEK